MLRPASILLAQFGLLALLGILLGCSAESSDSIVLPAFAATLPGRTAVCIHQRRPIAGDLLESLLSTFEGEIDRPSPDVIALSGSAKVGWKTLADSHKFAEAWGHAKPTSAAVVFLDLEQLVDSELEVLAKRLGPMARVLDLLFLEGFRFALFNLEMKGDALDLDGILRTSGTRAGLPGLLSTSAGGGFLGTMALDDTLAVDGRLRSAVVRQMIERAAAENSMTEALSSGVLASLPAIISKHWTGEISLRVRASGELQLALGLVERDKFEEIVTRMPFVREKSGDLLALPGGWIARVTKSVVYLGRAAYEVPIPAKPEPGLWVRGNKGGGYSATILRVGDDLRVSMRLPKAR